jgi:hypothetical protein
MQTGRSYRERKRKLEIASFIETTGLASGSPTLSGQTAERMGHGMVDSEEERERVQTGVACASMSCGVRKL